MPVLFICLDAADIRGRLVDFAVLIFMCWSLLSRTDATLDFRLTIDSELSEPLPRLCVCKLADNDDDLLNDFITCLRLCSVLL